MNTVKKNSTFWSNFVSSPLILIDTPPAKVEFTGFGLQHGGVRAHTRTHVRMHTTVAEK